MPTVDRRGAGEPRGAGRVAPRESRRSRQPIAAMPEPERERTGPGDGQAGGEHRAEREDEGEPATQVHGSRARADRGEFSC